MLPWWKRLLYSFISVLIGGILVGAVAACQSALGSPDAHFDLERFIVSTTIVLVASLPGWFVALPIVVIVENFNGWRLWAWGAAGFTIGPIVILGFVMYVFLTDPPPSNGSYSGGPGFFLLAGAVSATTTALYLLLVSRSQGPRQLLP